MRILMTYRAFEFFTIPGLISFAIGLLIGVRFIYFIAIGQGDGHLQSLVLCAILIGLGTALVLVGMLGDLISVNRKLLEKIDWRLRQVESQARGQAERGSESPGSYVHHGPNEQK